MPLKPQEHESRLDSIRGTPVRIVSYRLGEEYICTVDNVDPGAVISRGRGRTRIVAVAKALEAADAGIRD